MIKTNMTLLYYFILKRVKFVFIARILMTARKSVFNP